MSDSEKSEAVESRTSGCSACDDSFGREAKTKPAESASLVSSAPSGIAMGGTGTDAVIETVDGTLMTDDLGGITEAIRLCRRTLGTIRFNITFAFALKALFVVLTLIGHATLERAILADTGATLLVARNAHRLLRGNATVGTAGPWT